MLLLMFVIVINHTYVNILLSEKNTTLAGPTNQMLLA